MIAFPSPASPWSAMTASARSRIVIASVAAVASVLAGIVGNYLANRWSWGLAVAVLTLVAAVAVLEGAKAVLAARTVPVSAGQQSDALQHISTATVSGDRVHLDRSVVAAGDVDQSTTVRIHLGGLIAMLVGAISLLIAATGTVGIARAPGGRLAVDPSVPDEQFTPTSPAPDRSSPGGTLWQYIYAKFDERDDKKARVFECRSPSLAAVDDLLTEIEGGESKFHVSYKVSPENFVTSTAAATAGVDVRIVLTVPWINGLSQNSFRAWHFDLVFERGWAVCAARKLS
jgi:hypothetical protein